MPPRSFTNPAPKTESAREARKAFYCTLCNKGYARQNEFAAHESSYDHQHKKRLKDLKAMNKTMESSATKARRDEEKGSGLIKIAAFGQGGAKKDSSASASGSKSGGTPGGFKKGGFKKAFGSLDDDDDAEDPISQTEAQATSTLGSAATADELRRIGNDDPVSVESDTEDESYEHYDPRRPTDCSPNCKGWE